MEGLGKLAAHQKRKVGVLAVHLGVAVAVAVNSNNAICIFVYDFSFWIHTEGTHQIFIL